MERALTGSSPHVWEHANQRQAVGHTIVSDKADALSRKRPDIVVGALEGAFPVFAPALMAVDGPHIQGLPRHEHAVVGSLGQDGRSCERSGQKAAQSL